MSIYLGLNSYSCISYMEMILVNVFGFKAILK